MRRIDLEHLGVAARGGFAERLRLQWQRQCCGIVAGGKQTKRGDFAPANAHDVLCIAGYARGVFAFAEPAISQREQSFSQRLFIVAHAQRHANLIFHRLALQARVEREPYVEIHVAESALDNS